ncbi:hypothetical protein B0H34DRAFT_541183 [Crassisporium funariophilum]|nr:hypothetical protein B0H34DRAFT_541183 [Crassisporium funariophilum]
MRIHDVSSPGFESRKCIISRANAEAAVHFVSRTVVQYENTLERKRERSHDRKKINNVQER